MPKWSLVFSFFILEALLNLIQYLNLYWGHVTFKLGKWKRRWIPIREVYGKLTSRSAMFTMAARRRGLPRLLLVAMLLSLCILFADAAKKKKSKKDDPKKDDSKKKDPTRVTPWHTTPRGRCLWSGKIPKKSLDPIPLSPIALLHCHTSLIRQQ